MEPESSILKDYALLCRCGTVIPLQPPIVSWTLPYVKNKDVQLPTLFGLYLKPSSLLPSPPLPPFQRVKHHNILQLVDSFETKKEYFLFLELWVSSEALERHRLKCAAFSNPPPPPPRPLREKKEKEMVHYRRPCDGLFQSCRQQVTRVSHPSSATGREVFDWILDQGYYSERDTSNVMRQVLEAVAYLHSLKIVHRNLKVNGCTDT